ncbi:LuxR family transcriptional regulator [Leptospira wolffii]|uniref:LuxR family transcriptional regulator n=1 Tax=Leptospira wolffii TaxID=409998 RepID=UPI00058AE2E4|nr:LuxR C-terminal-related transcriptional regulator [Leptospira wolffii]
MDSRLEDVKEIIQRRDTVPDILLICDTAGQIAQINENGRMVLGIPSGENIQGMKVSDFLSDTDRKYLETVLMPALVRSGEFEGRGLRLKKKDGNFIHTRQTAYQMPIYGNVPSYVFIFSEEGKYEANNSDALHNSFQHSPSDTFKKYEGMNPETLVSILREKTKLTKKETEICAGIASGKDKSKISEDLGIHSGTMKNHLKSIYRKTIDLEKEIPGPERDKLQRLTIYLFRLLGE